VKLRIGGRGSPLSLVQLEIVAAALAEYARVEIVTIATTGDRVSRGESAMTGKDRFTKEVDEAVLEGRVDVAVHSLKDLPSELARGLAIAAVPRREDPSDVLVSRDGSPLLALAAGARVGSSSPRRRAQLLAARPDLEVVDARGNVDTRLRRLAEGRWDAIVLAHAGLARLGRLAEVTEVISHSVMLPAIGQGALAVVARADAGELRGVLTHLDHAPSRREVTAERSLLSLLDAGCRAPVAGLARHRDGRLHLAGAAFDANGSTVLREEAEGPEGDPEDLGRDVARRLFERGAAALLAPDRAK
jgi:hydroxymethylbilane synthase